ncbi:hypothetical protein MCOR27_003277 [Pyricularia oryzae]|nr:hypothetical protein MCOR01_009238 [Pyricularia oryzae]KAI6283398.1 hypothetical protein MCOR27_003277 [Pyricularia oryzae]KAI6385502.1 hypothetical protein MCOR32_001463 [Pyricularia oryzae]KAI6446927.1 hypothetical protein MCOR22_003578 [Pyricularia oryzae]KAI6627688.1 hypothetical protein MCOR07_001788 [Pyricularia oryzae]
MAPTLLRLVTAVLAGQSALVQGQAAAPTAASMTTSLWWPKDIPSGAVPTQINGSAFYNDNDFAQWTLVGQTHVNVIEFGGPRTTTAVHPTYYWPGLVLRYTSGASIVSMEYTRADAWTSMANTSTLTGINTVVIVRGECTSVDDRAECTGSYGVNRVHISTVLPSGSSSLGPAMTIGPEAFSTQADVTPFPSRPLVTSIAVTVTQTDFAEVNLTPTSSSTNGVPRATGNAGVLAGAAALVGGAMVLI